MVKKSKFCYFFSYWVYSFSIFPWKHKLNPMIFWKVYMKSYHISYITLKLIWNSRLEIFFMTAGMKYNRYLEYWMSYYLTKKNMKFQLISSKFKNAIQFSKSSVLWIFEVVLRPQILTKSLKTLYSSYLGLLQSKKYHNLKIQSKDTFLH